MPRPRRTLTARVSDDDERIEKMRREGLGDAAVANFEHYYARLRDGDAGVLPEDELEPVEEIPSFADLHDADAGEALDQTVVLKLNGGLGTSMGMTKAKSLLEVKDGMTFLDIIVRQVLRQRETTGARLPLVLMNSFATRDDSLELLARYDDLEVDVPADFVQNKVPKLLADDLTPVDVARRPGQGVVAARPRRPLHRAGHERDARRSCSTRGYRYAFVSNSDNLGAMLEPRTLAWFAGEDLPVPHRGHRPHRGRQEGRPHRAPARGRRASSCARSPRRPTTTSRRSRTRRKHRYFNANTIWLNLPRLKETLDAQDGVLGLPMIVNRKTVDPGDKSSPGVIQLETAMGAAIDVFDGAQALHVPRERFIPVKTTNDLLVVRSDAYELDDDFKLVLARRVGQRAARRPRRRPLQARRRLRGALPAGPAVARRLHEPDGPGRRDVRRGVVCRGDVVVEGPAEIAGRASSTARSPDGSIVRRG